MVGHTFPLCRRVRHNDATINRMNIYTLFYVRLAKHIYYMVISVSWPFVYSISTRISEIKCGYGKKSTYDEIKMTSHVVSGGMWMLVCQVDDIFHMHLKLKGIKIYALHIKHYAEV